MKQQPYTWKEVVERLEMHPSGVQGKGWSLSERPDYSVLENFLTAKTYVKARWPQVKAQKASDMLFELRQNAPQARVLEIPALAATAPEVAEHQEAGLDVADGEALEGQKAGATAQKGSTFRFLLLFALAVVPTGASVGNMYAVAYQVGDGKLSACLFTILLSVTALGFTIAGVRSRFTVYLAVFLVGYEAFCNLARTYTRLMPMGVPAEFTGQVSEVFGSGSHGTALVLALITALIIACVQYAAIWEMQKTI